MWERKGEKAVEIQYSFPTPAKTRNCYNPGLVPPSGQGVTQQGGWSPGLHSNHQGSGWTLQLMAQFLQVAFAEAGKIPYGEKGNWFSIQSQMWEGGNLYSKHLQKIYLFYLKGKSEELFHTLVNPQVSPKHRAGFGWSQELGTSSQVSPMGGRVPTSWAISCCLPAAFRSRAGILIRAIGSPSSGSAIVSHSYPETFNVEIHV